MKSVSFFVIFMLFKLSVARKNWALLVAGSNGYYNYRHQADVCHAYQVLHQNGIPDEQIVVMMYDDIAMNSRNPVKGNLINQPNGPNVYPGVPKDYTGHSVNSDTFFAVLQGNKTGVDKLPGQSGKVIESGPDDHIFVFFSDHGATGLLAMPRGKAIQARALNNVLKKMHKEKKFAKLVFYTEACESGSMFYRLLPKDIHVFATTASNSTESSYAIYYDKTRKAYLGDEYSVHWIQDTAQHNVYNETFGQQFLRVKAETKSSHVQHYGDLTFSNDVLASFMAVQKGQQQTTQAMGHHEITSSDAGPAGPGAVPSEMVPIMTLKLMLEEAPEKSAMKSQLEDELTFLQARRAQTRELFENIVTAATRQLPAGGTAYYEQILTQHEEIDNWDCYETAIDSLVEVCPGLDTYKNDFALRKLFVLVNLCNKIPSHLVLDAIQRASVVESICRAVAV